MRIFVTGATGFVGSAVVRELISSGHQVLGLARSDAGAHSLAAAGAETHRGDLEDLQALQTGAAACDGVIHTAFIHDFSRMKENCEVDERAIAAIGNALAGSDRPFIVTSGVALISPGQMATEEMPAPVIPEWPRASERAGFALLDQGVKAMAMRLPPSVHGAGDHGFVPILINLAREKGVSAYVRDGANRWPAVHRLDSARLYRLALEGGAAGAQYHAIAEEGVPFREIAEVIGQKLNLPVVGKTREEAGEHFGWCAGFAGIDCPASSARTREALAWQPAEPGLIPDLAAHYFKE